MIKWLEDVQDNVVDAGTTHNQPNGSDKYIAEEIEEVCNAQDGQKMIEHASHGPEKIFIANHITLRSFLW